MSVATAARTKLIAKERGSREARKGKKKEENDVTDR
jgi:hypothetical protein